MTPPEGRPATKTPASPAEPAAPHRYILIGTIDGLTLRPMRRREGRWASFRLLRDGDGAIACVAFGGKAEALDRHFRDGDPVRLSGVYETCPMRGRDGSFYMRHQFRVEWSESPKALKPFDARATAPLKEALAEAAAAMLADGTRKRAALRGSAWLLARERRASPEHAELVEAFEDIA